MIALALAFMRKFWPQGLVVLCVLGMLAVVWLHGRGQGVGAWKPRAAAAEQRADTEKQRADELEAHRRAALRLQERIDGLAGDLELQRARAAALHRSLREKAPLYVTANDCPGGLSGGVRVFHDAAAARTDPDPEPAGVAAAAAVSAATLAATVADNYAGCHSAADQVEGWQRWWAAVKPQASE